MQRQVMLHAKQPLLSLKYHRRSEWLKGSTSYTLTTTALPGGKAESCSSASVLRYVKHIVKVFWQAVKVCHSAYQQNEKHRYTETRVCKIIKLTLPETQLQLSYGHHTTTLWSPDKTSWSNFL